MKKLTIERLKEVLNYNPETGLFIRLMSTARCIKIGEVAGTKCNGYSVIMVDNINYPAHRLAWFYMTGKWPIDIIDHKNGIRYDNKFSNLREATPKINAENKKSARIDNSSGVLGVEKIRSKFRAHIVTDGKKKHIGMFDTAELAHIAYVDAKRKLHEGCTI